MSKLTAEIERLRSDLEKATESRKQAQRDLYDARERFQKELLRRTGEISRLLKEREGCEPFGYFRPEPFGWTDCAPDDEGAIPLYTAPQKRETVAGIVTDDMRNAVRWAASSAYWSVKLVEFFGADAREGIAALERQLRDALAAPPNRKPLSDEQIAQILRGLQHGPQWSWDFLEGFRAAERAHGIGGQS